MIKKRLMLYQELFQDSVALSLPAFCFDLPIHSLIGKVSVVYSDSVHLLQDALSSIFSQLQLEVCLHYLPCMKALPLECLDPAFLLRYLPPGLCPDQPSAFWRTFSILHPEGLGPDHQIAGDDWAEQLYLSVALEYVEELGLPGKALVVLQEGAQRRGLAGGGSLTRVAKIAVDRVFLGETEFSLARLLEAREDTVREDVATIQVIKD